MSVISEIRPGVWCDADRFVIRHGDKRAPVTKSEFALCRLLASHPGHIKSSAAIHNVLIPFSERAREDGVKDHVKRLRAKLAKSLGVDPIKTHRGEGYSWDSLAD